MKKYWWLVIILLVVILSVVAFFIYRAKTNAQVTINNKTYKIELALTEAQREQGLMNRKNLDANSGMLFIFPSSGIQSFWMKNTLIPLDILWINDGKIVEMTTLQPQAIDYTPQYTPKNPANYVLEINAGEITRHNFKVGDTVKIKY